VWYFNGVLFVFTLVFQKCAHYSTDFGELMFNSIPLSDESSVENLCFSSILTADYIYNRFISIR